MHGVHPLDEGQHTKWTHQEMLHLEENGMMLTGRGVQHQTTPSYTPEHNGVAELFNRTVQDMLHVVVQS